MRISLLISATQSCGSDSLRPRDLEQATVRISLLISIERVTVRIILLLTNKQPCKSVSPLSHEASLMTSQPCTKKRPPETPHRFGQLTCTRTHMRCSQVVQVRLFASTRRSCKRQVLSVPPAYGRHSAGQAPEHRLAPMHFHICARTGQLVLFHPSTLLFWDEALSTSGCGTTRRCHRSDDLCISELICACTILHALHSAQ